MKVSGFTFIRNAVRYDYPIKEAILSILPVCDEVVVMLGNSDDDTRGLLESISSDKIKIFDSVWDDSLREGGQVLAVETDKAFAKIDPSADWAFYIQGDELFHENGIPAVLEAMHKYKDHPEVEGLLFKYLHFYGSYDFIGDSRRWYRNEVRIIRNTPRFHSYKDAQGFKIDGRKPNVKAVDAYIYHYGWVKPPESMQAKQQSFQKLWHTDEWVEENVPKAETFDYSGIDSLARFKGTHPAVMADRIARKNWQFTFDPSQKKLSLQSRFLHLIERITGWRIGEWKNYRII
ncbi:MAG TPA: glycosyltransferase family 2 protein [Bacteroidia bacterium]|nr:glycosyltransferase family 2 protein [Bacteroidia bacterium]